MGKRIAKYILWLGLPLFGAGIYAMNTGSSDIWMPQEEAIVIPQDTIRFPVAKTTQEEYTTLEDMLKQSPADLRDPENVKTTVEYDIRTGRYLIKTRIGDSELSTPLVLTPQEYQDYSLKQSMHSYFRQKNEEAFQEEANKEFNLTDMQFDLGVAERVFGPGGVRIKTQGSATITMGLKNNTTQNPSLPESSRSRTFFNFDESVQLNVQASVGSKVSFGMDYNTETSFDFDSKKLKLAYQGEEDEIIKNIEAGNVSMTTNNSLINGGAALFGMKADLQFGKLRVNTLFAQQESESKTVNTKGGAQTKPFEITVDQYDERRHFFLSHYFYDDYDQAVKDISIINSAVQVTKVEVWITNKRSNFNQSRNIVAFSDLAEPVHISNPGFVGGGTGGKIPYNEANNLYRRIIDEYPGARDIGKVTQVLGNVLEGGWDFEKVESARLLEASEYSLNEKLGYISLRTQLQPDEVLGVAYQYTYGGKVYQVGEFSTDNAENTSACLYVKLLKGTSLSPGMPFWKLMMKNVYSLNAYSIQKEKFKLDILYQSDTTGMYINYIPEGNIKNEILIRVMNLDRLDSRDNPYPDGFFDFVEGITVNSETGRIFFPSVEPFGSYLKTKFGNDAIAEKYIYQELYDSTLTVARQIAEKNKFILRGEFKASSGSEIQLGGTNIARGSVKLTAGGIVLTENVDYTIDYTLGTATILNESLMNVPISVNFENQSTFSMQRKTMMGLDVSYEFNKDFSMGATVMHMSEMPLTVKTAMGDESIKNTLWGLNTSYKKESQWLTNMLDKIPLLQLTQPSQIAFNAEFAHLIAGHYENKNTGGYSYLDDFESTQSGYNLQNPYSWQLASTPFDGSAGARFPEAAYVNDIEYGKNRALMAWYYIDGIFTRRSGASGIPGITKDEISKHYVRAIPVRELYPNRNTNTSDASTLPILNVAYYPNERGPYNLDADRMNADGTLAQPETRWGGIMRKIDQSDFETANVEYLEFWLLDPFIESSTSEGGDLYFNLGEISEDILKDEKKFFENGLPIDGDLSKVEETVWGRVPKMQSTVYAFDNTAGAREKQDVGLNGLSSDDEKEFPTYQNYVEQVKQKVSGETLSTMMLDAISPINDPAGDNYLYYRDDYYNQREAGVLERYKRFNGTEGNSKESDGRYNSASKTVPDVEDINQDNTLNENEKYYEYRVSLRKKDLVVGQNHIVDMRTVTPTLENGQTSEEVHWYLFKIPIKKYERSVGSIRDFKTIRFMRMYMTDFKEQTVLRFGTLELVRGEWRSYEQSLAAIGAATDGAATLEVSSVNIEENGSKEPVNYVLPPGVTRMYDASQSQLQQENEQALSMKVTGLSPMDARAIYKTTSYDLRQYRRLQLFVHAERLKDDTSSEALQDGDLSVFIRLGSDYKSNYYEYEVPLMLTPHGIYNNKSGADQLKVWPTENKLNFRLEALTDLKLSRNRARRQGNAGVDYHLVYSEYDPDSPDGRNRMSIVGNPSLAEVKTIMIGIRNNSKDAKNGEVWVNELRLTDFNEEGGWAANANLSIALSDLGSVNASGRIETAGFGSLDQSLMERRMEDFKQYSVSTNLQLGKFFPEKAKVNIPFYYAYSKETLDPEYNPLDQDIKLKDALDEVSTKAEKDSIRNFSQDKTTVKSIAFNNVKVDIRSKNPMPYDPANFSLGYSYSENNIKNPETEYETTKDYRANFAYSYSPYVKPFQPFGKIKKNNGYTKYVKQLAINYLPNNITFQTSMSRNYYEIQLRDLNNVGMTNSIPASFSSDFRWDRAFNLSWKLTNNLNFNFTSGTNARIEEPHVQVNKKLNPDQYQVWKDSVRQSIRDMGTPMKYDQTFKVTWTLPLSSIPVLDWTTATADYTASYNWDRGALLADSSEIGNVIKNQRTLTVQGNMNFQTLYNKNAFLKKVNQKFTARPTNTTRRPVAEKKKPAKVEIEVKLNPDSATVVTHRLLTKKVRITARRVDNGKSYPLKYKGTDMAHAVISNKDTVTLKLTVMPGEKPLEGTLLSIAEHSTRFLMMTRRLNVQYTSSASMMLPGFRPEVGDMFGQHRGNVLAPGLGFAFGDVRRSFIDEAVEKEWLVMRETNVTPAQINKSENLLIRADLEPITGLKINLNATRTDTRYTEVQYMYDGMPEKRGGSFNMTIISLKSAFKSTGNAANGYRSSVFDKFLENRNILANRLQQQYDGTMYPTTGFMTDLVYSGEAYNEANGKVNRNSGDVLIPAFIAAYTGKDASKISFSPFPTLKSLVPNWSVTYDGLMQIPLMRKHFKSLTLSHNYRSTYSVGSYSSYMDWVGAGNGLGFVRNTQTGDATPSSLHDIASVTISESFTPLLGADATLLNNMTGKLMYNTTRTLNLNVTSYQIVESLSRQIVAGMGYKITEFNKVLKRKPTQNFSNDLDIQFNYSYQKTQALIRKIEENVTQATSGNITQMLMFSAEYGLSRALSIRAFYDLQINKPLISSASYPTSNSNFGVTVRFSLAQ